MEAGTLQIYIFQRYNAVLKIFKSYINNFKTFTLLKLN